MVKVIVVYDSRYDNTRQVAETIVEGIRDAGAIEPSVVNVKDVDVDAIVNYDAILLGGPNHFGGPTRSVRKFIDRLSSLSLAGKQFAAFDTYMEKDVGMSATKMEQRNGRKCQR